MTLKIVAIIPARYQSSRFPGKPLVKIQGISLLQRTYENAKKVTILTDIIIATDDKRIFDHAESFGAKVVMTSPECHTGTDRIAEVAATIPDADLIVNIQGDEPCLDPESIELTVLSLINDTEAVMSTAASPLAVEDALHTSVVKCVFDNGGRALYFSRSLIPGNKTGYPSRDIKYFRHIGLYVFRRDFLLLFPKLKPTPLMLTEDLEQLKVLEHGYKIQVVTVNRLSPGVDTPDDIQKVENFLCQQNISL